MTLDREDVEAIALRVAELLRPTVAIGLVGVEEVVARFGVSRSYVYEHADELGAIRLGDGPKARLRFGLEHVVETLSRTRAMEATPERTRRQRARRSTATGLPPGVKLIRGRNS